MDVLLLRREIRLYGVRGVNGVILRRRVLAGILEYDLDTAWVFLQASSELSETI